MIHRLILLYSLNLDLSFSPLTHGDERKEEKEEEEEEEAEAK